MKKILLLFYSTIAFIVRKFFKKDLNVTIYFQFIKHGFIGLCVALINYVIFNVQKYFGISTTLANTFSNIIVVIITYLLQKYFTYRVRYTSIRQIILFIINSIIYYITDTGILYFQIDLCGISPYIGKFISLLILFPLSFLFQKYIVFKPNQTNQRINKMTEKKRIILDGHKLYWHKERVEALLRGERVAPITIDCALTRACGYHCIYCYGTLQENEGGHMTRDTILNFLDDAAEIGVKAISFVSDGESAYSPYIYDAISHGKKNGLDMAFGTCAYPLKEEKLEDMLKDLTYFRFNFSAGTPDRYAYIHGVTPKHFEKVVNIVKKSVEVKRKNNLTITIGLQMVLMPQHGEDILPLAQLGKELGVDYLVIKHTSDDEHGSLGVKYDLYNDLVPLLKEAESYSTENYSVTVKWSKIMSGGKRRYTRCYGPPLILQMSGSGLVAPCGMLFNDRYKEKYHIGNVNEKRFKDIWMSDRYLEVMNRISSDLFNAKTDCGSLCLQHKVNEFLWDLKKGSVEFPEKIPESPLHINFI